MNELMRPVMTDENKKLLTKYLGERWRDKTVEDVFEWQDNRTFNTLDDMMDLYHFIVKKEKWESFIHYAYYEREKKHGFTTPDAGEYEKWLFCLSGEGGYEERCQMVADWLWKEASHESR
jgi:hypothetical protein